MRDTSLLALSRWTAADNLVTAAPRRTLTLLALLASLVALTVAAPATAAEPRCYVQLLDDWIADDRIDGRYPAKCYREALDRLPEDVEQYSSAREDIERALRAAIRRHGGKTPAVIPPEPRDDDGANGASGGGGPGAGPGGPPDDDGLLGSPPLKPTSADSVPIPLLVLAGLALLLLASAAVAFAARRVQARRVRVAPLPSDTPPR